MCRVLLALGWALVLATSLRAELLYYDPFLIGINPTAGEYTLGPLGGQNPLVGPTPFLTGPWVKSSEANGTTVQAAGLGIPVAPAGGGSAVATGESRTGRKLSVPWNATANGTFYMSFMVSFGGVDLAGSTREDVGHRAVEMWGVGHSAGADESTALRIGYMSYNSRYRNQPPASAPLVFGLGIGNEQLINGGPGSFLEDAGAVHRFVLKFVLGDSPGADQVKLFLDSFGEEEPLVANAEFSGVDFTLGSVSGPVQFGGTGSSMVLDEIRVGTTFADVNPQIVIDNACTDLDESCYLAIVQSMHGVGFDLDGDLNHDGRVDLYDLRIWRDNRSVFLLSSVAVPEPDAVWLLAIATIILLSFRLGVQTSCISVERKLRP